MASFPARAATRIRRTASKLFSAPMGPVYLVSAGGQPNFGDEFITRSWLDWLAEHHPDREVWLDTIEPGRASHLFRDTHPRLRTTNTLWHLAHTGPKDPDLAAERARTLLRDLGSPRYDLGLRELRRMESVHLLGGGYMNEIWPENFGVIAAMTTLRAEFGVRIFATGQGFMPVSGVLRDRLAESFAQFDYVEARDAESADAIAVHAGVDDAFLAFANRRELYAREDDVPEAMVLVQGDMFDDDRDAGLRELVNSFAERHSASGVGFAEAIPPDDSKFAAEYVADGAPFFPFVRMWDHGFPARAGQEWLTSRFHFHLLAAAAGAKGTIVNARPGYYDVKHSSLVALGTGWTVREIGSSEDIHASVSPDFPDLARVLGAEKSQLAERLYTPRRDR